MLALLRHLPVGVWIGIVIAIGAGVIAFAAYHQRIGGQKTVEKVVKRDLKRVEKVRKINRKIDEETRSEDEKLMKKLREIDEKWLSPRPQDTQSSPASVQQ